MQTIEDQIKETIQKALPDADITITGDGVSHFEATVYSSAFKGLSLLKQHLLVMKPLKRAFADYIHALSLKTYVKDSDEPTI